VESKLDAILEQLMLTNRLLALLLVADENTVSKKGLILLDSGFRPKDVSEMLGVPIGTITKARSRAKHRTEH
jgi:Trp operon repressor